MAQPTSMSGLTSIHRSRHHTDQVSRPAPSVETMHEQAPLHQPASEKPDIDDTATAPLRQLLESLPQELYDEIHTLVFTINPGPHLITRTYRVPSQLQINHKTRVHLTKQYYSQNAIFRIDEPLLKKWVQTFWDQVFLKISNIEVPYDYLDDVADLDSTKSTICVQAVWPRRGGAYEAETFDSVVSHVQKLAEKLTLVHTEKRSIEEDWTDVEIRPVRLRGDSDVSQVGSLA